MSPTETPRGRRGPSSFHPQDDSPKPPGPLREPARSRPFEESNDLAPRILPKDPPNGRSISEFQDPGQNEVSVTVLRQSREPHIPEKRPQKSRKFLLRESRDVSRIKEPLIQDSRASPKPALFEIAIHLPPGLPKSAAHLLYRKDWAHRFLFLSPAYAVL